MKKALFMTPSQNDSNRRIRVGLMSLMKAYHFPTTDFGGLFFATRSKLAKPCFWEIASKLLIGEKKSSVTICRY